MVLEVGETDLSSFLKARGSGLPPALVLHYWEEMLLAVLYIHEHGEIIFIVEKTRNSNKTKKFCVQW